MKSMKVGIIGVGGAGRAHAIRFARNPYVSKVYGYDIKEIEFSKVEMVYDLEQFMAGVDAVSICTPDDTHFEYIKKALCRNRHVLVEKPMVASAKEALELRGVLDQFPHLKFGVHHQMRFVPAFAKAKEIIDSGELGQVFYAEANYWHDMRERNVQFDNWRVKGRGQSVIFGGACHPLDLMLYLLSENVVDHKTFLNKNAYKDYPLPYTSATIILRTEGGVVVKVHTNNCVVFPQFNDLVIMGDEGTYIDGVLFKNKKFKTICSRGPSVFFKKYIPLGVLPNLIVKFLVKGSFFRRNSQTVYDHESACDVIVYNFVSSVLDDSNVLVDYKDGLRVVNLCEKLEEEGLHRLIDKNTVS